jgi:hypothetical protein
MLDEQFSNVFSLAEDGIVKCRLPFVILNMDETRFSSCSSMYNAEGYQKGCFYTLQLYATIQSGSLVYELNA